MSPTGLQTGKSGVQSNGNTHNDDFENKKKALERTLKNFLSKWQRPQSPP